MHDEWLTARIAYLRGLKSPSDQQRLLLLLADKPERSNDDNRKLSALVKAEKAAERAQKAKANEQSAYQVRDYYRKYWGGWIYSAAYYWAWSPTGWYLR